MNFIHKLDCLSGMRASTGTTTYRSYKGWNQRCTAELWPGPEAVAWSGTLLAQNSAPDAASLDTQVLCVAAKRLSAHDSNTVSVLQM